MNIIDIFIALGRGMQGKFGRGDNDRGRMQQQAPLPNYYSLNEVDSSMHPAVEEGQFLTGESNHTLYYSGR